MILLIILFFIVFILFLGVEKFGNNTFGEFYMQKFQIKPDISVPIGSFNFFNTPLNYNPGNGQLFVQNKCLEAPRLPGAAIISECKTGYGPQQEFIYDEDNRIIFNPYYGLVLRNDNTFQYGTQLYNSNSIDKTVSENLKFSVLK